MGLFVIRLFMSLDLGDIQRTKNTAELIADALRSAILRGKLKSGQSLKQDEIATEFKVSKIPVREALVQLQAEGLVRLIPSRGAIVSSLTLAEVDEIYTMRHALEPIALRRAIPNMTAADFDEMEHLLNKIDHETDLSKWAERNWEFHEALYRPANMPHLLQTTRELHNNVVRFLIYYISDTQLKKSQQQHRELLKLCRARDVENACALLLEHLRDPVQMFASNVGTE
jgi:DNA-binding GntR family transcriptional regulator